MENTEDVQASCASPGYAAGAINWKAEQWRAAKLQSDMEVALLRAKDQLREMDVSIERVRAKKEPKQTSVGGDINNIYLGTSLERIVIYICITVVLVCWLSA